MAEKLYYNFGGTQTSTNRFINEEGELKYLQNATTESPGTAQRRSGYAQLGGQITASKDILGGWNHYRNANTTYYDLVALNEDVYKLVTATWTAQSQSLTADSKMEFESYMDMVFMCNKDDYTRSYDGTSFYTADSWDEDGGVFNAPKAKYVKEWKNILYLANCNDGTTDYPSRIYYNALMGGPVCYVNGDVADTVTTLTLTSVKYLRTGMKVDIYTAGTSTKVEDLTITAVNRAARTITFSNQAIAVSDNDEVWIDGKKGKIVSVWDDDVDKGDYVDFKYDVGGEITGIAEGDNRLLVFKKDSLHYFDGSQPGTVSNTVGTPSHRTIKNVRGYVVFLHPSGVYAVKGGEVSCLSNGIYKDFVKHFPADLSGACADVEDDRFYKVYIGDISGSPRSDLTRAIATYDFDSNQWEFDQLPDTPKVYWKRDTSTTRYQTFGDANGEIFQFDGSTTDDGNSIPFIMEMHRLHQGAPGERKRYKRVDVHSDRGEGAIVNYSINGEDYKSLGTIDGDFTSFYFSAEGRDISFKITHKNAKTAPQILAINVVYNIQGEKGARRGE